MALVMQFVIEYLPTPSILAIDLSPSVPAAQVNTWASYGGSGFTMSWGKKDQVFHLE
jgi:hypothetical protein